MTQYNTLNKKLPNSPLNKLKSGIKNGTEAALKILLNVLDDSNDDSNFPHKLLLTNTQVSRLRRAIANNSSAIIKPSKTQFHKIGQSRGILGRLFGPLLKTGLPIIANVLKPLAKSILMPLWLTASVSAISKRCSYSLENVWIRYAFFGLCQGNNINNFEWGNEWYHENN